MTVPLVTGLGPADEIVYRCSFADGFEPAPRNRVTRQPKHAEAHLAPA